MAEEEQEEEKKPIRFKTLFLSGCIILAFIGLMIWIDIRTDANYTYSECYEQEVTLKKQYLGTIGLDCESCLVLEVEATDPLKTQDTLVFGNNKEIKETWRTGDILILNWCNYQKSGTFVINGIVNKG